MSLPSLAINIVAYPKTSSTAYGEPQAVVGADDVVAVATVAQAAKSVWQIIGSAIGISGPTGHFSYGEVESQWNAFASKALAALHSAGYTDDVLNSDALTSAIQSRFSAAMQSTWGMDNVGYNPNIYHDVNNVDSTGAYATVNSRIYCFLAWFMEWILLNVDRNEGSDTFTQFVQGLWKTTFNAAFADVGLQTPPSPNTPVKGPTYGTGGTITTSTTTNTMGSSVFAGISNVWLFVGLALLVLYFVWKGGKA